MKQLKPLEDLIVRGKRVFLRVDFNVPIDNGKVGDELRIAAAIPTINYLIRQGAIVILASHLGRPDGKPTEKYSLEPVAIVLSELLKREVFFMHDCVGEKVKAKVMELKPGQVALLENLRFHAEEEENDQQFAKELASLGEVYINDAFAVAHRGHASVVGIPKYLPHAAGKLIQGEVARLTGLLTTPAHPFVAIIGGAKISDKIDFMHSLLEKVDTLIIGGAMANTFLAAQGHAMGKSVLDKAGFEIAMEIMKIAERKHIHVVLPVDVVVANKPEAGEKSRTVMVGQLDENDMALDIGPMTSTSINAALHGAKTIFWNGTLGFTEIKAFSSGSLHLAKQIASMKALSVIGGGDTAGFVDGIGMHDDFGFISTGGGAALELLAGKELAALKPLYK
jgi:phosphoglycerate kinase